MKPPLPARVAILGGGPAGVTLAAELTGVDGLEITLLEKEEHLGGLHKTVLIDGCSYDIGTFLFRDDHEYFRAFPGISSSQFLPIDYRAASIRLRGSLDAYPMSLAGYARDYGFGELMLSALDCVRCRVVHRRRDTLPAYVKYYIGERMYRRSGLKRYIERLYHTRDVDIDLHFAEQRLQMLQEHLSLRSIIDRLTLRLQGRQVKVGRPVVRYVRPAAGFQQFYGAVEEHLAGRGIRVMTGRSIQQIQQRDGGFAIRFGDQVEHFDLIVSTIPVPTLAGYIDMPVEARFEYMKLISLFYRFRGNAGFDGHVLFNYSEGGLWKRVTRFSEYYGRHAGDEYFGVEVTAREPWDITVESAREDFEHHARSLGLFDGQLAYQGHAVTDNAYPLFHVDEIKRLNETKQRIRALGIHLVGRQGNFEYISSWLTTLKAKALAESIRGEPPQQRQVREPSL
jgi:protoporphyrinogen oxidase